MGQSFSEQQIQNLISTVDANNDGRLDFEGIFYKIRWLLYGIYFSEKNILRVLFVINETN